MVFVDKDGRHTLNGIPLIVVDDVERGEDLDDIDDFHPGNPKFYGDN